MPNKRTDKEMRKKRKMVNTSKENVEDAQIVILFEMAGKCSSLHRAHPENKFEAGWNAAVEAMLKYIPQPTMAEYVRSLNKIK